MEVENECETKLWEAKAMDVEKGSRKFKEKNFCAKLALDTILDLVNKKKREKYRERELILLNLKVGYKVSYKGVFIGF